MQHLLTGKSEISKLSRIGYCKCMQDNFENALSEEKPLASATFRKCSSLLRKQYMFLFKIFAEFFGMHA